MKLKDHNWAEIEERASVYMQIADNSSDEGYGEEAQAGATGGMRANIEIDW